MRGTGGYRADGTQTPSNPNPILNWYEEWSNRTPYVTRVSVLLMLGLYIFSWLIDLEGVVGNIPAFTILYFEIYRLLLSPWVGNSLLNTLILLFFYPMMAARLESSIGSGQFLSLLGILTVGTNLLFCSVCLLLWLGGMAEAMVWSCDGYWLLVFGLIVIECMQMPDAPRQLCCIPYEIPSRYFPLVLYAFFCLFSGLQLDFLCAMAMGYLYFLGHCDAIKPSQQYLVQQETSGFLTSCSRAQGWVLAGSALGSGAWAQVSQQDDGYGSGPSSGSGSAPKSQSMAGRGHGNISGFGGTDSASSTDEPRSQFPGSGHTLANSNSSSASTWATTSSLFSSAAALSSTSSSSSSSSREELAARRLAALEKSSNSKPPSNSQNAVTATTATMLSQPSFPSGSVGIPIATAYPATSASDLNSTYSPLAVAPSPSPSSLPLPSRLPVSSATSVNTDPAALSQLMEMGFNPEAARAALEATNGDFEAAIEVLSSG